MEEESVKQYIGEYVVKENHNLDSKLLKTDALFFLKYLRVDTHFFNDKKYFNNYAHA